MYLLRLVLIMMCAALAGGALAEGGNDYDAARAGGYETLKVAADKKMSVIDRLATVVPTAGDENIAPSVWAHILMMNRHFDLAATYYDMDAGMGPKPPQSRGNLAVMLVELHQAEPDRFGPEIIEWALAAARSAWESLPSDAGAANVVSRAADAAFDTFGDPRLAEEAMDAALAAVELDPDDPLLWANLARLRLKAGDEAGANAAEARAKAADPNDPGYWIYALDRGRNPQPVPVSTSQPIPVARDCGFSFRCQEICAGGGLLTGGVKSVTCELEQDTQIGLCKVGKRHFTAYDCDAEKPIQGERSVGAKTKVCLPAFCITLSVNSDGSVGVEVEAGVNYGPVQAFVKEQGRFDPQNGYISQKTGGGTKWNLMSRATSTQTFTTWNVSPLSLKQTASQDGTTDTDINSLGKTIARF